MLVLQVLLELVSLRCSLMRLSTRIARDLRCKKWLPSQKSLLHLSHWKNCSCELKTLKGISSLTSAGYLFRNDPLQAEQRDLAAVH